MNTAANFVTRNNKPVVKALAFGLGATLAISLGMAHAQEQRELRAQIQTLPTVVVNVKRVAQADIQRLPTVIITGRRMATADDTQVASARVDTGTAMF
jgi:hypothetical protein